LCKLHINQAETKLPYHRLSAVIVVFSFTCSVVVYLVFPASQNQKKNSCNVLVDTATSANLQTLVW